MKMKKLLLTSLVTLGLTAATMAQNITNFTSIWYNTFSSNSGGFGRAIIDNNDLVISGLTWPTAPSGTRDQMITKINPSGNIIFQTVRAPGGDHDFYVSVAKLQNGNYGFFGQQNAQGTQYFDAFYTEFNSLGVEVSYNYFPIPGYSSGSDMLLLPNGNLLFTGNDGAGQFIAITDQNFNQLNYQTFAGAGWVQLSVDSVNNVVFGVVSDGSTSSIQIVKYDFSLNYITTHNINNSEGIMNYDVKMDGSDLLLCGFKVINGQRYGTFYRMNTNGIITDSFVAQNISEYTALEKYGTEIILAKSNLSGTNSISNELNIYQGSGMFGISHSLNSSSPFVPFDLVLNGDTLYAVGAQGSGYWIGIPAVEKLSINAVTCSNSTSISPTTIQLQSGSSASFTALTSDPNPSYVWQSDFGQGFQTLNNFGNYSGTNTATLNVSNVQLSEHNQPIRVITTSGNCIDTSNVAIISIADTCINTITDTTFITVTDTLVINTTITGLNPPNNANTIKVFPNPTNNHITIDYGNFSLMNGYQLKIENSLGQQVFQTNITQQSDYLNLTTWGGNGLYFVHIIDPQGNTIDIRKIVLQ
jgi:hypothetical protein